MRKIITAATVAALSLGTLAVPTVQASPLASLVAIAKDPTIDSPIKDLLADPDTAAILEKHLPGIAEHPARPQFEDMTLAEVMPLSGGAITQDIIDAIEADIEALEE